MNAESTCNITRRTALGAVAGLGAATFARAGDLPRAEPRKVAAIAAEYRRLRPLFEEERKKFALSSNTHDYWKGPAGKAIIALGPAIIPHLIQEVRKGDFFFNVPLEQLTNIDIVEGDAISEQEKSKLWLKWWEGKGG